MTESKADELRRLAQAVDDRAWQLVDAGHCGHDVTPHEQAFDLAADALADALDLDHGEVTDVLAGVILAALDAERDRSRWQPIETAPEGETIMLWTARGRGPKGVTIGHVGPLTRAQCTHWQPIPAPPEAP